MLGLLYGISPDAVRMAFKLGGDMPAELKNIARHEIYLRDKGIFTRYSAHLGEFAQQLDQMFRLPIFVSEVGREAHAKLLSTGRDFFLAQADLAKAVKLYGAAPGKLVEMRLAVQQLERELAAKTPKMLSLQRQMMGIGEQIQARRFSNKVEFDRLANAYGRIEARYKEAMADQVRRLADIGALHQRIPQMRLEAAVADRAIMAGNRLFGSYARLNPFERTILRRILPFYTFNKAMTSLAFRLPYIYPKRAFVGAHLAQAWFDITSDDNAYMPARLRNYVPVAALADGSVVAISAAYLNPMGGVRVGNVAELPVPSAYNPLTAHPVIQLAFRMAGAITEWSSKPLSPGAYATRLDNGTVIQWTGNGFKTTIAQPSVFKSIADLFPQAQLIDKLLHPYAQTDRGWLFNPEPILGPDGKPRYPKELVDILLSNVIPTQTYNRDEVRSVEQAKMAAVIKSYIKDLKYASPDRRQQILDVLNGWKEEKNRKWVN
jgi:hypothetical protein